VTLPILNRDTLSTGILVNQKRLCDLNLFIIPLVHASVTCLVITSKRCAAADHIQPTGRLFPRGM
jgi:hypothetical protein